MGNKRERFTQLRKQKGTQAKVAADNGISNVYLRMIENGTFTPGRDLMFRLAGYFDEPADSLFPDYFKKIDV
ncbi:helix-turn-helix transcriptional regulator [Paenibacillus sp. NFR01]|uniref:helix-turn-helix domain-containing protein n=1 Tax=Paenibacillus sp. NFR01 TaxID=1566279 RepID=UPI0008C5E834|nr:helix-turn-helix transcriptional regulator [Paenibacillus sp. NFR01]SEU32564.1 Helix-turn-helix domain-containing protein [Paenibacillus sp. NFR01]